MLLTLKIIKSTKTFDKYSRLDYSFSSHPLFRLHFNLSSDTHKYMFACIKRFNLSLYMYIEDIWKVHHLGGQFYSRTMDLLSILVSLNSSDLMSPYLWLLLILGFCSEIITLGLCYAHSFINWNFQFIWSFQPALLVSQGHLVTDFLHLGLRKTYFMQ